MSQFFITGLPRSRTAWLANLFTTGGPCGSHQFCHHDLLGKVSSLAEFRRRMQLADHTGDSDSGLVWIFPKLRELYPAARWILIERDPAESIASVRQVAGGTQWQQAVGAYCDTEELWLPQYVEHTERMLEDNRVARLPYALLDNYESVAAAWRFVCPGSRLSRDRFELLHPLKVEVMPAKVRLGLSAGLIEEIKAA